MLRLAIDAANFARDRRGMGRVARTVIAAARARGEVTLELISVRRGDDAALAAEFGELRLQRPSQAARRDAYDVVWYPWNGMRFRSAAPTLVTINDAFAFDEPHRDTIARWREQSPIRRAAREATRVLMLTSFTDDEALFTAIMAGASGYVLKNIRGTALVDGIHQVARGRSLLDPAVTTRVLARLRGDVTPGVGERGSDLTAQERKVLNLVAEGLTNRQIGERVHLAEKTVKNYVSNILMKLGLSRRAEVAAFMAKRRLPSEAANTIWP